MRHRLWLVALIASALLLPQITLAGDYQRYWPEIQSLFPEAASLGSVSGDPPSAPVLGKDGVLGYVVLSNDVLQIPAYSGKPINALIGIDVHGVVRGIRIVEHQEPILLVGVTEADLTRYTDQYARKRVSDDIRVGGTAEPGRPVIDAISGATITVMVINRVVNESIHRIAETRGLLQAGDKAPPEETQPLWQAHWQARQSDIFMLGAGLVVLLLNDLWVSWRAMSSIARRCAAWMKAAGRKPGSSGPGSGISLRSTRVTDAWARRSDNRGMILPFRNRSPMCTRSASSPFGWV